MIIEYAIENYNVYAGRYVNKIIVYGRFDSLKQWERAAKIDENYNRKWTFIRVV